MAISKTFPALDIEDADPIGAQLASLVIEQSGATDVVPFTDSDNFDPLNDQPIAITPEEVRNAQRAAKLAGAVGAQRRTYREEDFVFDVSADVYWCLPLRMQMTAKGVDSCVPTEHWRVPRVPPGSKKEPLPIAPSKDLARIERDRMVEGCTWLPGYDTIVEDILATKDGFFPMRGVRAFNTYRQPPTPDLSLADKAGPWVEHVKKIYPEPIEHEYFFDYCAHMIQRPEEKCNAAIVVSGKQGIGKDFMLAPLRYAVGQWNCANISPDALLKDYNPWVESVMLTVDEVRPQQDDHRATAMYDSMKTLIASPPDVLPMNNKHEKVRYVANVLRLFLTTNDRMALYLPPDDRRVMVMHSPFPTMWYMDVDPDYFKRLFHWMSFQGGAAAIAGWLATRDLSNFDAHGLVPKTGAWREVQQSWEAADDEVTVALEVLGHPNVLLGSELPEVLFDGADDLKKAMRSKAFVFRMMKAGYTSVPRPDGVAHWRADHAGVSVKTANAYVKESLGWSLDLQRKEAQDRAIWRAKGGKQHPALSGEKKESDNGF